MGRRIAFVLALLITFMGSGQGVWALEDLTPMIGQRESGTAAGEEEEIEGEEKIPEPYRIVLEAYEEALAGNLEEKSLREKGLCPLLALLTQEEADAFGYCLKDINGDDIPELFLGVNGQEETIYQLFTVSHDSLALVFTAREMDFLHLLSDESLLRSGYGAGFASYSLLYVLESGGYVTLREGLLYDSLARRGPFFKVLDDGLDAASGIALTEEAYYDRRNRWEEAKVSLEYDPLRKE